VIESIRITKRGVTIRSFALEAIFVKLISKVAISWTIFGSALAVGTSIFVQIPLFYTSTACKDFTTCLAALHGVPTYVFTY